MSLTSSQWAIIKFGAVIIIAAFGVTLTYGVFKGGVSARVTANEKTIGVHGAKLEQLSEHAARSETDMAWMKKAVEGYDEKQEVVLKEIRALKQ